MSIRKIITAITLTTILALGAGAVGAQEATPPERPGAGAVRALIQIVADETGLEPQEIITQAQEGASLADIVTANGGDVNAVIDAAIAAATERINAAVADGTITQARADRLLANLEDVITRAVNGDLLPQRPGDRSGGPRMRAARALLDAAADETGLGTREIMEQLRAGSTLADIITANGGSVDQVVSSAVADATEQINTAVSEGHLTQEQADELIAALETVFSDAVNGELPARPVCPEQRLLARGLVRQVAEAAGLEFEEVVHQLQSGTTMADILTTHGVDVATFTNDVIARATERLNQAVENGRITQEQMDEMIARLNERLPEILNTAHPAESSA